MFHNILDYSSYCLLFILKHLLKLGYYFRNTKAITVSDENLKIFFVRMIQFCLLKSTISKLEYTPYLKYFRISLLSQSWLDLGILLYFQKHGYIYICKGIACIEFFNSTDFLYRSPIISIGKWKYCIWFKLI